MTWIDKIEQSSNSSQSLPKTTSWWKITKTPLTNSPWLRNPSVNQRMTNNYSKSSKTNTTQSKTNILPSRRVSIYSRNKKEKVRESPNNYCHKTSLISSFLPISNKRIKISFSRGKSKQKSKNSPLRKNQPKTRTRRRLSPHKSNN